MKFDQWLRSTGLSESSVLKYLGAREAVLFVWARDEGIITDSILNITSTFRFNATSLRIRELPIFQERNSTGHNMYSSNKWVREQFFLI